MVAKTIFMLAVAFVPLAILSSGIVASPWVLFALYILSGLGMAGTGMSVMHDAMHGSYSKNRKLNKYMGYTMNLLGGSTTLWRIQHNVLHHTYPNVVESDDDIDPPFFLRFSPHAKRHWMHRFQHLYVWFFYGMSTLSWVTANDFIRMNRYRKMGYIKGKNEFAKELLNLTGWKLLYYTYTLVETFHLHQLAKQLHK